MTEQEIFNRAFKLGLEKAADWMDKEAELWVQDRFKDRIMQLSHDIREIAGKCVTQQTAPEKPIQLHGQDAETMIEKIKMDLGR